MAAVRRQGAPIGAAAAAAAPAVIAAAPAAPVAIAAAPAAHDQRHDQRHDQQHDDDLSTTWAGASTTWAGASTTWVDFDDDDDDMGGIDYMYIPPAPAAQLAAARHDESLARPAPLRHRRVLEAGYAADHMSGDAAMDQQHDQQRDQQHDPQHDQQHDHQQHAKQHDQQTTTMTTTYDGLDGIDEGSSWSSLYDDLDAQREARDGHLSADLRALFDRFDSATGCRWRLGRPPPLP